MLKNVLHLLVLILGITASTISYGVRLPVTDSKIEQIQENVRQLNQEIAVAESKLENYDKLAEQLEKTNYLEKRIDDMHQSVATYGMIVTGTISVFGLLLTGLIIFFSVKTTKEARTEASLEAEDEFNHWIAKNGAETLQKLIKSLEEKGEQVMQPLQDSLKTKGEEFLKSFDQKANENLKKIQNRADQQHQQSQEQIRQLLKRASSSLEQGGDKKPLSAHDTAELNRLAEELKSKPESSYSFDDWRTLYLEAGNQKAFYKIEKYVANMERMAKTDWQQVTSMHARSLVLAEFNKCDESIKLTDQLISLFGASSDTQIQERVASALYNKGNTLRQQGRWKQAIAAYEDVVTRYGGRTEAGTALLVAKALFNKGATLGHQSHWEQAIAAYDDVVTRYGDRTETAIVELVKHGRENRDYFIKKLGKTDE